MVVSVVLVTFISLTFVGTAILLQMQIGQMKNYWYDKAQVAVYLCTADVAGDTCAGGEATDGADRRGRERSWSRRPSRPFIDKFYFEDHDAGVHELPGAVQGQPRRRLRHAGPAATETFWVNLKDPSQSDVLDREPLRRRGRRAASTDQRQYLDQIFSVLNAASYTAIGIAALMLVAAVLLIATTIRLSAFSRRRELGIMRLVGASNRFIQTPFILEGVIAALIGSVLAAGARSSASCSSSCRATWRDRMRYVTFVDRRATRFVVVPILIVVGVAARRGLGELRDHAVPQGLSAGGSAATAAARSALD